MVDILDDLLSLSGILLIVGLVMNYLNKDSPWSGKIKSGTLVLSKLCGILLALFAMTLTYDMTNGSLGFEQIGIYVACVAIIYASWKDLMTSSAFAANLTTVAMDRATRAQDDLARRAAKLSEDARVRNERTKEVRSDDRLLRDDTGLKE